MKEADPALAGSGHTGLHVVYVSSARLPSRSANSVQVTSNCNALARSGCAVTLYGSVGNGPASGVHGWYGLLSEVRLRRCPWPEIGRLGGVIYALLVCISVVFRKRPDVVYGRHALSLLLLGTLGYPVAFEAHMPPRGGMDRWARQHLFRCRRFKALVVVSNALSEYYRVHFPHLDPERIIVAPNGSDDPREHLSDQRVSWPDKRLRAGYIGSFQERKGVRLVVELARQHPDVGFVLAGGSPEELKALGCGPLPDNVDVLGYLPPRDATILMCSLDILLAPYQCSEAQGDSRLLDDTVWGSPLKVFEYMASGVCAMVSDLSIVRELVGPDKCFMLCRPDDLSDWVASLAALKRDPVFREGLGQSARKVFEKKFSRQARINRILYILSSSLAAKPKNME